MDENTTRYQLPLIMPSQAQKHVTHNEAIRMIDNLTNLLLLGLNEETPPPTPANGDAYFTSDAASGVWASNPNTIAFFVDGSWLYCTPFSGMIAYNKPDETLVVFDDGNWHAINNSPQTNTGEGNTGIVDQAVILGINTVADETNRLSVKSEGVLFSADEQSDNAPGDVRLALNKTDVTDNNSILFQTGYSGRAELGCGGDENFRIKTSDDGSTFKTAIEVDSESGFVGMGGAPVYPLAVRHDEDGVVSRLQIENRQATPGSGANIIAQAGNGQSFQVVQYASGTAYFVTTSQNLFMQLTGANPALSTYMGSTLTFRFTENIAESFVPLKLPSYLKSALPAASVAGAGAQVYVSDELNGPVVAFSDGVNWRRCNDREVVS